MSLKGIVRFLGGMAAAFLPSRHWARLPGSVPIPGAAFVSAVATIFAGMAIGIHGFLEHARATTSLGLDAELHEVFTNPDAGYRQGLVMAFSGISIFTFLLLTPMGWATLYLTISGTIRAMGAWFDDPVGDPILTGVDALVAQGRRRFGDRQARADREAREGPEVADRIVSSGSAGIAGCDAVIVSSRRKPGWERGVAVLTPETCYRLGDPLEQTVAGRLRYLYPLTEHKDLEVIRRSVRYELPAHGPAVESKGKTPS